MTLIVILAAVILLLTIVIAVLARFEGRTTTNQGIPADPCAQFSDAEGVGALEVGITSTAQSVTGEIDVSDLATRLENEAMLLIGKHSQQGIKGDELAKTVAAGLRDLAHAPVGQEARETTSESFNLPGNLYAGGRFLVSGEVVRAEVLDENTCGSCRKLDGTIYAIGSPEYLAHMPPNDCEHGDMCRGFYISA